MPVAGAVLRVRRAAQPATSRALTRLVAMRLARHRRVRALPARLPEARLHALMPKGEKRRVAIRANPPKPSRVWLTSCRRRRPRRHLGENRAGPRGPHRQESARGIWLHASPPVRPRAQAHARLPGRQRVKRRAGALPSAGFMLRQASNSQGPQRRSPTCQWKAPTPNLQKGRQNLFPPA